MKVQQFTGQFRRELIGKYGRGEIDSLLWYALESVLGFSRSDIVVKGHTELERGQLASLQRIIADLKNDKPIQYILEYAVFYGMRLKVNDHVLIPRPETEELVHWIIKDNTVKEPAIIDLATGSGCIALALKDQIKGATVSAADLSTRALALAQSNATSCNVDVTFFRFDLLSQPSLGLAKYHIMVSNPPYVLQSERKRMAAHVVNHEPHLALFVPDEEPLLYYRSIAELAEGHLLPGGLLYFEINESYGHQVVQLLQDRGFKNVVLRKDFNHKDRMVRAQWY